MTTAMHEILIVDDEEGFRHSLGLVLEMEGYRVREAGSGSEAIQAIALQLPDLVLLDLSMPGTSGWDVLHHIRQDPVTAHLPVLIVTAHADEETRRRSLSERVDRMLVKPVMLDEVLNAVRRCIPQR